jgi:hypothetical protein
MKVHFDIDATPVELRTFFGLPNVEPLQKELLDKVRDKMLKGLEDGFDPMAIMEPFMPAHLRSLQGFQKQLWDAMTQKYAHPEKVGKSED